MPLRLRHTPQKVLALESAVAAGNSCSFCACVCSRGSRVWAAHSCKWRRNAAFCCGGLSVSGSSSRPCSWRMVEYGWERIEVASPRYQIWSGKCASELAGARCRVWRSSGSLACSQAASLGRLRKGGAFTLMASADRGRRMMFFLALRLSCTCSLRPSESVWVKAAILKRAQIIKQAQHDDGGAGAEQ